MFVGGITNIGIDIHLHTWVNIAISRDLHDFILTYGGCRNYDWLQFEKERREEGELSRLSFFWPLYERS